MFYVICPDCGAQIEVLPHANGWHRTGLWNVVVCCECDFSFDYDETELVADER